MGEQRESQLLLRQRELEQMVDLAEHAEGSVETTGLGTMALMLLLVPEEPDTLSPPTFLIRIAI